jgi:hypothetical protein
MNQIPENLPFAEIVSLETEQPREFRRLVLTLKTEDEHEHARTKHRLSKLLAGKVICALRRKNPDYFTTETGRHRRTYGDSCATAYEAYVLAPDGAVRKVPESCYDAHTTAAVECAARVVVKVKHKLEHPAVADAADILRQPGEFKITQLREICERIQERTENEGTEEETTRILYLRPEEYAAQQLAGRNAPSLSCASDSEPASLGGDVPHSELAVPLEKGATSTPDSEQDHERRT